jgi:hypothetical protein
MSADVRPGDDRAEDRGRWLQRPGDEPDKTTLAAAAEIVSVEARHAAWIRALAGEVAARIRSTADDGGPGRRGLREIGMRAMDNPEFDRP